jgi:hypothetical protein
MKRTGLFLIVSLLTTAAFAQDGRVIDGNALPSGFPHEQSLWEMVYHQYLTDNYDKHFLYATNPFADDTGRKEEVIYVLGIANNKGLIFEFENSVIVNAFEFVYDANSSNLLLGDVHGGVWSLNRARSILDNIFSLEFIILKGKDLLEI